MKFMMMVKADANTEAGELPDEKLLAEMGKYNEELVKAGVMLAGEGLQPSSKGARVRFSARQADRHRRPVRRDEGAHRRLLDDPGEVEGGGDRVGRSAAPIRCPDGRRDRDPPGVRGGGFRRGAHARAAGAGAARPRERMAKKQLTR